MPRRARIIGRPKRGQGLRILTGLALLAITLLPARPAEAIPPFARIYDVPCSTCHVAITRRGEFGEAFRKNGYRWPGPLEADVRAQSPEPIEMRGVAAFEAHLLAQPPLGASATFSGQWTNNGDADNPITLGTPSVRLLFGGPLGDHFSFFGTWAPGQGPPRELAMLINRPILDSPAFNLRIGQFEQSTTLFKINDALAGSFLISTSSLTGGFALGQSRMGIEATGIVGSGHTFYAIGAVQDDGHGTPMDVYYQITQKFGGTSFAGMEPDVDLESPTLLDDISLTLGHWGYMGQVVDPFGEDLADILRFGVDTKLRIRDFSLWSGVMLGMDVDRTGSTPVDVLNLTGFGEVSYLVFSWMLTTYSYHYQDSATFDAAFQRHDAMLVFLLLENIRARLGFGFTDDNVDNESALIDVLLAF